MPTTRSVSALLFAAATAVLAACAPGAGAPGGEAASPAAAPAGAGAARAPSHGPGAPRLLRCALPAGADSASREIGPEGGVLALRGNRLALPPGAVGRGIRLRLVEPASDTVQVEVRPDVPFLRPASLTLSYARCGDALPVAPDSLRIYRRTGDRWRDVGGPVEVDRVQRTVTTRQLDHLSQYALGSGG